MGSVKDLTVLDSPTIEHPGRGRFVFSDRYSIFDWGEMPDHIDQKGAALCIAAAYFFEKLEKDGISTHYLGLVENGQLKPLSRLSQPVNILETKLYRVLHPELTEKNVYDYKIYQQEKGNYLIPLEIIYRNALPLGSSVFKRLQEGKLRLEDLGLKKMPEEGIQLSRPYLDVSTKLEASDRYLSWQEAQQISQLSDQKIGEMNAITLRINQMISEEAQKVGLKNEDGKFEFALDQDQNIVLVDVLGTLDECRFTYQGMPVSKEIARLYYRKSDWYQEIMKEKEKGHANWKQFIMKDPEPLPARLKQLISTVYCAFTNEITGKDWFKRIPSLAETLEEIQEFIKN
ncbi:MAG TPA: phosphoribosylaminoimidazolesuccinocarboxamide synthase [Atribacterota bacterium]|nr:phosphoribosylaminoimidazolesuccinocarboxamide synthase [Atribacterota bacterium]